MIIFINQDMNFHHAAPAPVLLLQSVCLPSLYQFPLQGKCTSATEVKMFSSLFSISNLHVCIYLFIGFIFFPIPTTWRCTRDAFGFIFFNLNDGCKGEGFPFTLFNRPTHFVSPVKCSCSYSCMSSLLPEFFSPLLLWESTGK